MDPNNRPSEEQYRAMLDRTEQRVGEFTDSSQFEGLTRHQMREAEFVLENVGEFLAAYLDVPIDDPDRQRLEIVCTEYYPAKVGAEPDHFSAVAPVLAAFLRFLDARGQLDEGARLATHVEELDDEIVEAAVDPANWGMAKSMTMGREIDVEIAPEEIDERNGELHRLELSEDIDPSEAFDRTTSSPGPTDPIPGLDSLDPPQGTQFSAEEREAILDAFDSVPAESDEILQEAATALIDPTADRAPQAVFQTTDVTPRELEHALNEVLLEADIGMDSPRGNPDNPLVLDPEQAERFFDWYGKLLVYVNNRFDVVPAIETYEEFAMAYRDETYPIREYLYTECPAAEVIEDFVAENPSGLTDAALSQIETWKHYETGDFVIVEHRESDTVILDPDGPRAFAVTGLESSHAEIVPENQLPAAIQDVVLLPFEDTIVTDPWIEIIPQPLLEWREMDVDVGADYEEAKLRFGMVESLPAGEEPAPTDAEKLRIYTKNKENRERFAEDIEQLKDKTDELARIYHEQLGKASARRLGREFRELGLEEAYVALYDGRVVTTARTEKQLQDTLSAIMPDGKADHPYVYHYDP